MKHFVKGVFFIRGVEVREKIPFPVLKINFEPLGSNEKHSVKEVLD